MTQDKTIFEGAKWNSEPQQITINYSFSEKMVNDYFRALAHLLKRLHDNLAGCRFGVPMPKDNKFKAQIIYIKEQTPTICERIYNEDKKLMIDTYDKIWRMRNKVLDILNNAPDTLVWKGGSLNQSLEDIKRDSKVYAEIAPESPLNTYYIIETIKEVCSVLGAKVGELKKECSYTISPEDMPSMDNIRTILLPEIKVSVEPLLRAIWEQWTMERYIQPMKGVRKPDAVKAATFYHILTRAKYIEEDLSLFYDAFNRDLGINGSREAVNKRKSKSQRWSESIIRDIEKSIKSSIA